MTPIDWPLTTTMLFNIFWFDMIPVICMKKIWIVVDCYRQGNWTKFSVSLNNIFSTDLVSGKCAKYLRSKNNKCILLPNWVNEKPNYHHNCIHISKTWTTSQNSYVVIVIKIRVCLWFWLIGVKCICKGSTFNRR